MTNLDICDYVDNRGVRQVWFYTFHNEYLQPSESNMQMGTIISGFWNHDGYGDVSNGEQANDLVQCKNTYVLYNYNFNLELGQILENQAHHMEQVFNFVDGDFFWNYFVGSYVFGEITNPRCGWTHYPPNGEREYDWNNLTEVLSDCDNWNPEGTGEQTPISCKNWDCADDTGASFKTWWMQHIPGYENGLEYDERPLINWWGLIGDLDNTLLNNGRSLTE